MTDEEEQPAYVETEVERAINEFYRQRAKLEFGTAEYENITAQLRALQEQEAARMMAKHNADFGALTTAYDEAVQWADELLARHRK